MNVLRRIAMAMGGTVVVALVIGLAAPKTVHAVVSALVTVANTPANPVPAQEVKESRANFVTLSFNGSGYDEILPDGSKSVFAIPTGQQFVITDVSWITVCENVFTITCTRAVGDAVVLTLGGNPPVAPGPYTSQAVYGENVFLKTAGRSDALKSGLVVAQVPTPSILFGTSGNGEQIFAVTLRGYLVP